jgi:hypothetical protein
MRFLFSVFGMLSVLSLLLLIGSVVTETLNGYKNFQFSGTELTINFSGIDRILLSVFIVSLFLTFLFWMRISGRG